MKKTLTMILFLAIATLMQGQSNGSLSGVIIGSNDNLTIPGVQVMIKTQSGQLGAVTDINGHFTIKPLKAGTYTLIVKYTGYQDLTVVGIDINNDFDTDLGKLILNKGIDLDPVIIDGGPKLIDKNGGNIRSMPHKQWVQMPNPRNVVATLTAMSTEFFVDENSSQLHFRGGRSGASSYIVDGIRVESLQGIPGLGIGSMTVYAGGIPAKYGDFTGGVVVVETMGYFDWLNIQKQKDRAYYYTSLY